MEIQELLRIFQAINKNVKCPQCGAKYRFENIKIERSEDNICFVSLHCGRHMPMLASIALRNGGIDTVEGNESIKTDEVIKSYEKLKKIKSINELFKEKDRRE